MDKLKFHLTLIFGRPPRMKPTDWSEFAGSAGQKDHVPPGALPNQGEGSMARAPRWSGCCWAARASSEGAALDHFAERRELVLKSASVTYSCGGKTPTWRRICRPSVFSFIRKEETCTGKPREVASLSFIRLVKL